MPARPSAPIAASLSALLLTLCPATAHSGGWHGEGNAGVAADGDYPTQWSRDEGVLWKAPLSGRGASTPCVSGDRVFLTDEIEGQNGVLCLSLNDGSELWRGTVGQLTAPKHRKASGANPSPVTDGERVYAYFKSGDLAAFTVEGDEVWSVNIQDRYGKDTLWWDLGTSPVRTADHLVVTVMQTGPSFLVALDPATGDEVWKTDRQLGAPEEAAQSYSTPAVVTHDGLEQLITVGADHVTAHAAVDGRELWRVGGLNPTGDGYFRSISSAAVADGIAVAPYARGESVTGVRLGGGGDVTDSHVVWSREGIGSDVPTPVVHNGRVYLLGDKGRTSGRLWCLDLKTGEEVWTTELPKSREHFSSSPVLAGENLYLTREDGATFVVSINDQKLIATCELNEPTYATPVFADNTILLRTGPHLWRLK